MSTITFTQRRPSVSLTTQPVYKDALGRDFVPPEFTIKDILDAIPKHCFERSLSRSLAHVVRDLFYAACLFGLATQIYRIPYLPARVVAWVLYGFCQGLVGTGLWVLAHECGHGAFSPYKLANDTVGWLLHSCLFVPYHSWRITHSKHHKATGHLARDMVFVPRDVTRYKRSRQIAELTEEAPIVTLFWLLVQQVFGWPAYLAMNVTGQKYKGVSALRLSHFDPSAPMFDAKDFGDIIISDVGILVAGTLAYLGIQKWGWLNFVLYYFIPYLWINNWLVCITYLQHTDPSLPHYDASEWNFARGAAATIDRDFGFIGRHLFHEIIETHVAHHYSSRIPFYHAEEATQAIRKVMGKHYRQDKTNLIVALYKTARTCHFVEGDDGVKMYRNCNGIGIPAKEQRKAR
ncbi:fatty acid desaturase-domain-containing protein [Lipomyces kononenkoae]|uniref:Fatty acid desaturase-domain-containing protein n=1 Tax=Lipomyces kononenkoae TaxID=34357 RepID=A0ACC3T6T8_LIPKO